MMNLNGMTVAELRKIAAELDVPGRSTLKKADLISAIEFAQKRQAEAPVPASDFDHAAAIAKLRADREAAEEEKAAARRARNRSNYAPAPAPKPAVNEVAILRDAPGTAIVTAAFDGRTVGGSIFRKGNRLVLVAGLITITGKSYEQVAKRFAKRLGFRADIIDVAKAL